MLDRLIRIEKKNIVEYYRENYTIETRCEFNDKGQIIKKINYHPDIQTVYCIEEFKNERNNNTSKKTYYKEDGKTIDYIMLFNKWNQSINTKFYNEEEIKKFYNGELEGFF